MKSLRVLVSTVKDEAEGKPGTVVWQGSDAEAARQRRIAEEQAGEGRIAWVE